MTQLDPHPHIFGQFSFSHLQEAATCFRQNKKWLGEHSLSQKINVLTEEVKKTESAPQSDPKDAPREMRSLAFDKPEIEEYTVEELEEKYLILGVSNSL